MWAYGRARKRYIVHVDHTYHIIMPINEVVHSYTIDKAAHVFLIYDSITILTILLGRKV